MAEDVPTGPRREGFAPSLRGGTNSGQERSSQRSNAHARGHRGAVLGAEHVSGAAPQQAPVAPETPSAAPTTGRSGRPGGGPLRHWTAATVAAACVTVLVGGTHSAAQQSGADDAAGTTARAEAEEPLPEEPALEQSGSSPDEQVHDPEAPVSNQNGEADGSAAEPSEPAEVPQAGVVPFDATDTKLTYHHWTGTCTDYRAIAEETPDTVTITVIAADAEVSGEPVLCTTEAVLAESEVTLAEPIGERTLLDEQGQEIPER